MKEIDTLIHHRYECIEDFSLILETPDMACSVDVTRGMSWIGWKEENDEYTTLERHHVYLILNKEKLDKYFRIIN